MINLPRQTGIWHFKLRWASIRFQTSILSLGSQDHRITRLHRARTNNTVRRIRALERSRISHVEQDWISRIRCGSRPKYHALMLEDG